LFLALGVFINAGSGESSAFTFSRFFCRLPTLTRDAPLASDPEEVSPVSILSWLFSKVGFALLSEALVLESPVLIRLGSLGEVGRITLEMSLSPGSRAGRGMGTLISRAFHLPGGLCLHV
jgi:hypothetical protein